jgi:hypothetical protein
MRSLVFAPEANGAATFGRSFSDAVNARALAPSTAASITVPTGAVHAVFSATQDFWAKADATPTIPGDVDNGAAAELNPTVMRVQGLATIGVIAEAACKLTVAFYG